MIVYSSTKQEFRYDILSNDISGIIHRAFIKATGKTTAKSEIEAWKNSLQYMDRILEDPDIPDGAGVAIEYHIPQTSKRIDFIVAGIDSNGDDTVVLIELKQ